jgi:lysozyme family protein
MTDEIRKKIQEAREFEEIDLLFGNTALTLSQVIQEASKGRGFDFSPSGLLAAEKSIASFKQLSAQLVSGTLSFSLALMYKNYVTNFSFVREPALQTIGNQLGGYFDVMTRSLADQERLAQSYRQMALSTGMNAAYLIGNHFSRKLINSAGNLLFRNSVSAALMRQSVISGLQAFALRIGAGSIARALGLRMAASGAAAATGIGAPVAIALAAWTLYDLYSNYEKMQQATRDAQNKELVAFFNPKALMSVYQKNAFLLGEEVQRGGLGDFRGFIGTDFEDQIAEGLQTGEFPELNSWSAKVYNSAMRGNYSEASNYALDIRGLGVTSEKILDVRGFFSKNTQTDVNPDVIANIFVQSGIYTGGDTSVMQGIVRDLIRSNKFTDQDVNEVTVKFEEFFAAVVGDGRPQAAHLNLVAALSSFNYNYAMGVRGNFGASTEIAKIHQFLTDDNGTINERFDVSPTTKLIQSVDDILLRGTTYQDLNAARIVRAIGISREEAMRGVTYDSNTLDKFLSGLVSFLNVDFDDITNNSLNFSIGMQNFANMTRMDTHGLNVLMVALRRYAAGENIEDVRASYAENIASDAERKIDPYQRFSEAYENVYSIMSNLTYSQNKMLDATAKQTDNILAIYDLLKTITDKGFQGAFDEMLTAFRRVLGKDTPTPSMLMPHHTSGNEAAARQAVTGQPTSALPQTGGNEAAARRAAYQGQRQQSGVTPSVQSEQAATPAQEQAANAAASTAAPSYPLTADEKFKIALGFTKQMEGGLSLNPNDPGNWTGGSVGVGVLKGTKFGISAAAYPHLDIQNLTIEQAEAIYKRDYWDRIGGDSIPFPASIAVFDLAVNSGVSRARRFWRQSEGLPTTALAIRELQNKRREFVRGLSTYETFGRGWENRINSLDEEISKYLSGYALGGVVMSRNSSSSGKPVIKNVKKMHIYIPIISKNPNLTARNFSNAMEDLLGV